MSQKEKQYWNKVNELFKLLKGLSVQQQRDILEMVRLKVEQENIVQKVLPNFNQFSNVS